MKRFFSTIYRASLMLVMTASLAMAQSGDDGQKRGFQFTPASVGVNFGVYTPAFEYYERTFWDFPQAMGMVGAEGEVDLHHLLKLRAGVGFGTTSSTVFRGQPFGTDEKLQYNFIPIGVSLLPNWQAGRLNVHAGPSVDFMHVRARYTSRSYDTKVGGNTMTFGGVAGLSYRILPGLEMSVQGRYMVGEYTKQFIFDTGSGFVGNEGIDLSGPHISIGVKRRL
jgi:hypothetical protein